MIPDIRRGVLCVKMAADCLEEFEKEALAAQQERKRIKKYFPCAHPKNKCMMYILCIFASI